MVDSYKKQALAAYEKREAEGTLSPRIKTPTPAGLRDECYDVYEEKGRPKDNATLRLFFGTIEPGDDYSQRIRNFDIDKFRPLVTFLNNTTINTRDKNTRLLIWLLERKPLTIPVQGSEPGSPQIPLVIPAQQDQNSNEYNKERDTKGGQEPELESPRKEFVSVENKVEYGGLEIISAGNKIEKEKLPEENKNIIPQKNESIDKITGSVEIETGNGKVSKPSKLNTFKITISVITIFIIGLVYWFWKNNADKTIRQPLATEHCMYWTGQHYEPINCDNNDLSKVKVPLNLEQLNHQQRITIPDTLTNYALGKVWYGKVNGSIDKTPQFYTDSGTNPLDTTKRLLPLTPYMLNKYVSYERHLLNMLVWIVSLFVLFSLLVTLAYQTRPRHKKGKI